MRKPTKVLLHNDRTHDLADQLKERFPTIEIGECNTYENLPDVIATFQPDVVYAIRFAGSDGYPGAAFFAENGPRWIANGGAGTDHLGTWDPKRTTVTNAAGVAADMMAEYVLGCFLHFSLDVPGLQADKAARIWRPRFVTPLKGKTILIVGLGHTGRSIATHAKAFGMTVLGTRMRPTKMDNIDQVYPSDQLLDVLPQADFIAVSTPLTDQTRGLIGQNEIGAMKSGVILADVSRGGVIDQSPLLSALQSGKIAGAGLDVFETEPLPSDSPFWGLNNIILSPHCSAVHDQWEQDSFNLFLDNLQNWENGDPLFNIVDPNRGY
jgi:phosphoglycerate dehydrogenase-like enzyme